MKSKSQVRALSDVLRFTAQDLQANQAGKLTQAQVNRHSPGSSTRFVRSLPLLPILGSLVGVYLGDFEFATALFIIGILVALVGFWGVTVDRKQFALQPVDVIEGRVDMNVVDADTGLTYLLKMGDRRFRVAKPVFLAFKNGDPYRIYFVPNYRIIVAAEWLQVSPFNEPETEVMQFVD